MNWTWLCQWHVCVSFCQLFGLTNHQLMSYYIGATEVNRLATEVNRLDSNAKTIKANLLLKLDGAQKS